MKRIVLLIYILCGVVLISSCQEKKVSMLGVWALEANGSDAQVYLILEKIDGNKVLGTSKNSERKMI